MKIPNEVSTVLVAKTGDDSGCWYQHHRSNELHIGLVSRCARRGSPVMQSWYCDYIPHQTFATLQDMQRAALVVPAAQANNLISQYPHWAHLERLDDNPLRPSCALFPAEPATHSAVLVRSWHPDFAHMLLLGATAVARAKKKGPATWAAEILDSQPVREHTIAS